MNIYLIGLPSDVAFGPIYFLYKFITLILIMVHLCGRAYVTCLGASAYMHVALLLVTNCYFTTRLANIYRNT